MADGLQLCFPTGRMFIIRNKDELEEFFHSSGKPRQQWRVGTEYEKVGIDRRTAKAIPYSGPRGVETILRALLMVAYALGRGTILLAVAVSVGLIKALNIGSTSWYIERLSGALILMASFGILLFYRDFVQWTMQWMPMGMMR